MHNAYQNYKSRVSSIKKNTNWSQMDTKPISRLQDQHPKSLGYRRDINIPKSKSISKNHSSPTTNQQINKSSISQIDIT